MRKLEIFSVMFCAVLLLGAQAGAVTPLSFKDTLKLAEDLSPSLGITRNTLHIRELEKKNAFAGFLPKLDLKSQHGIFENSTDVIRPDYESRVGVYLSQTIYDNHASILAYENAGLLYDIAKLLYDDARDKLYLQIAEAYFDYSLAMKLSEVQDNQLGIIRKQFQTLQAQYQQGLKTRRDYLRFKADLRRSEIDVQNAKARIDRSTASLIQLIGVEQPEGKAKYRFTPLDIEFKLVANVPNTPPDTSKHYLYRMKPLQEEVFSNAVYAAKRNYWPDITFTAGGYHQYSDYMGPHKTPFDESDSTGWSAGIAVNFNLWDWGIRSRNVQIAAEQREQSQRDVRSTLNDFSAQSEFNMISLQQSAGNFNLGKELLDMESSNYGVLEREYRNGTVTYLDLITSLRNLLDAKVTVYTNYFELRNQILRYRYYEGTLYDYIQKG